MAVSSLPNRKVYSGDGSSTSFSFPYYFFAQTDMNVLKYDTILGGVTVGVLGTDYTISGTANLQGLYQNGANVVMTVAPLTTDVLVIYRDPPRLQNYALLENGAISSTAIVQQFDYLTLLIQRLEDQISRALILPDGVGPSFSTVLPSNIALSPGMVPTVNAAGNGLVLNNQNPFVWQSVVVPFTSFQTAGLSKAVTLFNLLAGQILIGMTIKHSTAFTGSGISDVVANVGLAGDVTKFFDAFDVLSAPSDTNFDYLAANYIASWANSTAIQIQAVSTGANLSALAAGSVTVNYLTMNT